MTEKVLVITGGPGVGKTTIIQGILQIFEGAGLKVIMGAPTGRAAKKMKEATGHEAKTIHRMLEYDPVGGHFKHNEDDPLKGDLFIIDESSMLDVILAHQTIRAIPIHARVFFVGDIDQLPSVGPGNVLRDLITSRIICCVTLKHIFRQSRRSLIVENAHRVNLGQNIIRGYNQKNELSDFYFIRADTPERCLDLIKKLIADRIPKKYSFKPILDIQVLTPMQKGALGVQNLNQELQNQLNPDKEELLFRETSFRIGDRVMQIINNYEKDIFNGDLGTIEEIDFKNRVLTINFDDILKVYEKQDLEQIRLAYAITIHKSQGSEYPCVIIPIHNQHYMMLQRNLLYTAITRGKSLVIILGTERALNIAISNTKSKIRQTFLVERMHEILRKSGRLFT